jgi:hypothetical protein
MASVTRGGNRRSAQVEPKMAPSNVNPKFLQTCEQYHIKPTARQWSKWKNNRGMAWTHSKFSK